MFSQRQRRVSYLFVLVTFFALLVAACGGDEESSGGDAAAASGPVRFLYFSAADCTPCNDMAPIIDGIETDFSGKLAVERYDAASDDGKKLMEQYELKETPSYVMVAPDGSKLWALTGAIHKDMLRQQVQMRTQ
ncbi:MAG: thioredoxin [Caldilinea sp. CFX5]|nr:thioredoxin [Caldilinea sp. CFX5]